LDLPQLSDLLLYIDHSDDKMKMISCLFIGQFVNKIIVDYDGNYDNWLHHHQTKSTNIDKKKLEIDSLIDHLVRFIRSDDQALTNNMCKRYALNGLHACLPTMIKTSRYAAFSIEILINLIHLRHSTYNLVKCELVDLIASLDFKMVTFIQQSSLTIVDKRIQEKIINDVFIYLLGSDDSRLRLETARSLARFVMNMNFFKVCTEPEQNSLLSQSEFILKGSGYALNQLNFSQFVLPIDYFEATFSNNSTFNISTPLNAPFLNTSLPWISKLKLLNNNFIQPFNSFIKYSASQFNNSSHHSNFVNQVIEHNINYIIPLLTSIIQQSIDKFQIVGCLEAFDYIFRIYSPAFFYASNSITEQYTNQQIAELLEMFIAYLRHPVVAYDLYVHDIVIRLIGNLFSSYAWLEMKKLDKLTFYLTLNDNYPQSIITPKSAFNILKNSIRIVSSPTGNNSDGSSSTSTNETSFSINNGWQSQAEIATGNFYHYPYAFNNLTLKKCLDEVFVHCARTLCVLACVVDDSSLPSALTFNLNAGSTAVTSSVINTPILISSTLGSKSGQSEGQSTIGNQELDQNNQTKSKTSPPDATRSRTSILFGTSSSTATAKTKSAGSPTRNINQTTGQQQQPQSNQSSLPLPKTNTAFSSNIYIGFFQNSSHYLKFYEQLRQAYSNYRKSSQIDVHDKFMQILRSTLQLFAQLLESALSVHEIAPHLDEFLLYLRILFSVEASCSVKCVTLCLKSLFTLNLGSLMHDFVTQKVTNAQMSSSFQNQNDTNENHQNDSNINVPTSMSTSSSTTSTASTVSMIFSNRSKRSSQISLVNSLVTNQVNQFSKYLLSQIGIFKNESSELSPYLASHLNNNLTLTNNQNNTLFQEDSKNNE
jgi:hypothetical protein